MNIARAQKGSSSVEFAMVLPLLILFVLGIIDAGRLMWSYNRAEKAAMMAARYAAVTDMVPSTLASTDFTLQANGAVLCLIHVFETQLFQQVADDPPHGGEVIHHQNLQALVYHLSLQKKFA